MTEKRKQGFATLTPERQREVASMGGKAAHEQGRAHKWTSETARIAAKKGGEAAARIREEQRQRLLAMSKA